MGETLVLDEQSRRIESDKSDYVRDIDLSRDR